MHYSKILLIFSLYYILFNGQFLNAQDSINKRENGYSLLWKIEGNSLKKPSYLFGTMHVRNKKAFSFSDSVLVKLLNVDVFASEYDVDTMDMQAVQKGLEEAENKILFEDDLSESERNKIDNKISNKEKGVDFKFFKNKSFKELKEYFDNFESLNENLMPTYLDAYLFQIAKDNGIQVMGMESLKSGYSLMDTLSKEMQKEYISSKLDSLPYFFSSKEKMLNLYYEGNIDSIWQFYNNNSYYFKKIILDNRNIIMADTMETIMKDHSVFIAAGAAHLPGDSGLVQVFRNRGYTVSKVNASFTGVADSIMATVLQKSESWVTHTDSSKHYSIDIPYSPTSHDFLGGLFKMYLSQDKLKNTVYYFYAVPTVLAGIEKEEDVFKMVKTAFGNNKNIDIVSKKKISFNGIQGYELVLRNTWVFEAKVRIYMFNEHVYLQMVGNNKKSYNSEEASRFFASFKTFGKPEHNKEDNWTKYSYDNGSFSVKLPYEPNYMKKEVPDIEGNFQSPYYIHMYTCINPKDNEFYIIRWNDLPEGYYYDSFTDIYQETFAAILGVDYEFYPEKEIKLDAGTFQGYETVNTIKENSFELRSRAYIRGNRIYLLMGQFLVGNKDAKVDEFFNSFEGTPFIKTPYKKHNIHGLNIQLPKQPIITDDSENSDLWYGYIPYKMYASTDPNNGLLVSVNVNMYPKYYYTKSADSLLKEIEEETFYLSEISDIKSGQDNEGNYFRSGMVSDENSPNKIIFQYFLKGDKSYEIYTYLSDELLQDSLQNKVFQSIYFDATDTTFDIFKKKTDLIFTDLQSSDSTTFKMAKEALSYHPFDSTDISILYQAMSVNYADSTEGWGSTKDNIIDAIIENHDGNAVQVLKESFPNAYGSKLDVLLAIAEIDSLQKNLVYNLLSELPDTVLDYFSLYNALNYLADSSEFFKEKITELININKESTNDEALVTVINENFDVLDLDQEQLTLIAGHCTELYNLSYDSLLISDEESYNRYQFLDIMTSVLQFFTYDTSNNYDMFIEKAEKIGDMSINSRICMYNLYRDYKTSSKRIEKVMEDPENGWSFLLEASKLNRLSRINKKLLDEENLALIYMKYSFYWEDFVPEKIKLIDTRELIRNEKENSYYVYSFSDGYDEPYLAISGGSILFDGKLLPDEVIFNYSYETFDSEAKKEEIITDLISLFKEDSQTK